MLIIYNQIKIVTEETPHELFNWQFRYCNLCLHVFHEFEDCVSWGIVFSQQGVKFRVPVSNISALSRKRRLVG